MESSHSSHKNFQIDNSDFHKANLFKCAEYEKYSNFFHGNISIVKKYDNIHEFLMNGSLEVDCLGDTKHQLELIRYFFIGLENYEDFKRAYLLDNSFSIYKVDFIDYFHFGSEVVPLVLTLEPINPLLLSLLYIKLMHYFLEEGLYLNSLILISFDDCEDMVENNSINLYLIEEKANKSILRTKWRYLKQCFKHVFTFSKEDLVKADRFYYLACRGFADFSICKMCPYKDECKQKQIVK